DEFGISRQAILSDILTFDSQWLFSPGLSHRPFRGTIPNRACPDRLASLRRQSGEGARPADRYASTVKGNDKSAWQLPLFADLASSASLRGAGRGRARDDATSRAPSTA